MTAAEAAVSPGSEGCGVGPGGSIEVPKSVRRKAVNHFLNG
jgi:hypothetical protein